MGHRCYLPGFEHTVHPHGVIGIFDAIQTRAAVVRLNVAYGRRGSALEFRGGI